MTDMSGELNNLFHHSNDTMENAFHADFNLSADDGLTINETLSNVQMPEQLWQTPLFEMFPDLPTPTVLDFPPPPTQPATIDPVLLGDEDNINIPSIKAPPMQAGMPFAPPGSSLTSSPSAVGFSNSHGRDAFDPEFFTGLDLSIDPEQLDANADFDQHLTHGVIASPGRNCVLPDMSVFASGNASCTDSEPLADAPQWPYDNSNFAMPDNHQLRARFRNGDSMALSESRPSFRPNKYGFSQANLDSFMYSGPSSQQALVGVQHAPGSMVAPQFANYHLPITVPPKPKPIYHAMQELSKASVPHVGGPQQQARPVRLHPVGEFSLTSPQTNLMLSVPPPPQNLNTRHRVIPAAKPKSAGTHRERLLPPDPTGFTKEPAKKSKKKAWVRVNDRQGANNRGGKLNEYDPEKYYTQIPAPPAWKVKLRVDGKVNRYVFEYNDSGELYEDCYSAEQLDAYLRFHDRKRAERQRGELRVWIQKTPADSARRYANTNSSQCKFRECPLRQIGKPATIWQGHLRVAFDENYTTYGKGMPGSNRKHVLDPFANAGYCHLYCFERFLNLPSLLDVVTIQLDDRNISTEPNHNYPCRLDPNDPNDGRYTAAVQFMADTENGVLLRFPKKYPPHTAPARTVGTSASNDGDSDGDNATALIPLAKPHHATLNGVMQHAYIKNWLAYRWRSRRKERESPSALMNTLGDLGLFCAAKWPKRWHALQQGRDPLKVEESPKYVRGTKGYSRDNKKSKGKDTVGRGGKGKRKRKRVEYETETEDETEDDEAEYEEAGDDETGDEETGDEETGDEDDDVDDNDELNELSAHDSPSDESEDERPVRKARKVTSTAPRTMLRNGKGSWRISEGSTIHVRPIVKAR